MPKPYPQEFRDDVAAVARQAKSPLKHIAKDFGISVVRPRRDSDGTPGRGVPKGVGE